jgi:UDP-glucuronate decarboxylase
MKVFSGEVQFTQKDLESLEKLRDKRVLITGASGVIGLALRNVFEEWVQNFDGSLELALASKNSEKKIVSKGIIQLFADLRDEDSLSEIGNFDCIIHGATYAQPAKFEKETSELFDLNVAATQRLKEIAEESFLFLSTSEIYSGQDFPDEEAPVELQTSHPRAQYVFSKLAGEAISLSGQQTTNNVARIALAYGPGFKKEDSRVMYDFFRKAKTRGVIETHGSLNFVRTYAFSIDVALDLINILARGTEQIYNVGGTSKVSIAGLAEAVGRVCQVPVITTGAELATLSSAPKTVELNLSRIEKLRGIRNYVDLDSGLREINLWLDRESVFSND